MWWIIALSVILLAAGYLAFRFSSMRRTKEQLEKKRTAQQRGEEYGKYARNNIEGRKRLDAAAEAVPLSRRSEDGLLLKGYLYERPGVNKSFILVHGYTGDGYYDWSALGADLFDAGYNVLIVDDRAHGSSEGKWVGWGVKDSEDICGWCGVLEKRYGSGASTCILGSSMGGATVLMAGARDDLPASVKCVVSDCAFASLILELTRPGAGAVERALVPAVVALMSVWSLVLSGYSLLDASPVKAVQKEKVPVLFWHGTADTVVPFSHEKLLYDACVTEKELYVSEGAIHCGSHVRDRDRYLSSVTGFFEKHA